MSYEEILKDLRAKLGASPEESENILREAGSKFAAEDNYEGLKAVGELLFEIMPEDRREEVNRLTHLEGKTLDEYHSEIVRLINEKEINEAKKLAEKLYRKITEEYAEGETAVFLSLRNPFEDALYHHLFKPEKTINRAPFDFATYITTYGYLLIDEGAVIDAIPILEKAISYNPVDVGPKFELAEAFKLLKNKKRLTEVTRETIAVASSPVAIARCYANMGYILTETGDYEDAIKFYGASAMMAPHPAIPHELRNISQLMGGKPIIPPTPDQIKETIAKYDMSFGPDQKVIETAAALASSFLTQNDIPNAVKAMKILYNITLDEKVKELILRYDPNAVQVDAEGNPMQAGKPNITQTVNENPEK